MSTSLEGFQQSYNAQTVVEGEVETKVSGLRTGAGRGAHGQAASFASRYWWKDDRAADAGGAAPDGPAWKRIAKMQEFFGINQIHQEPYRFAKSRAILSPSCGFA